MKSDLATFLARFRPDGYITFVGIVPDGTTVAETFNGADPSQAVRWIEGQNRARNVYFTCNPTAPGQRKKPEKKDITEIAAVWADIDPRDDAGRPWSEERERLEALAAELHALETPPSFIIDSGSGIQPVWLLADPIEANEEYRQAAESLCAQIEARLGAKGTANVDRLLRVPGTRNFPNAKKRKLGRGETQSRLLRWTWRRHSWTELERLAEHLRCTPPRHAVPCEPAPARVSLGAITLPDDAPAPLEPDRLAALYAAHPDIFDLSRYDSDQSRQDLALASLARRIGWSEREAWRLIVAVRGDEKADRRDYIERTLARAYAEQPSGDPAEPKGDEFDLSHDGLALDMGRLWAKSARHVALWGKWLFWANVRWELDEKLLHLTRTRSYLRARADSLVRAAARGEIENFDVDRAEALAKQLRSAPMVANVVGLARSNAELVATVEQWDANAWAQGTPGGTLDLRTGILRQARIEEHITKSTAVAPAAPGTPCPLWTAFLEHITAGDQELQRYLQRFAGYALTGSIREHAFAFGYGTGANGKTVFIETLAGILGDYALTVPTEMLMVSQTDRHPTELARLQGVRFAIGSETEDGRQWAEAKIKSLTGGDKIAARYMRQYFFELTPQFKLFVVGNHKPSLRGVDEAITRRMHIVPFTVTIPPNERDPDLREKLKTEWPAIYRWMIDGCLAWRNEGLNPPACVRNATSDYLAGEDTFERWRDECTTTDPNAWESIADLWGSWKRWAEAAGEFVGKQRKFSDKLEEHGLEPERQGKARTRGYTGLRLNRHDYTEDPRYGG